MCVFAESVSNAFNTYTHSHANAYAKWSQTQRIKAISNEHLFIFNLNRAIIIIKIQHQPIIVINRKKSQEIERLARFLKIASFTQLTLISSHFVRIFVVAAVAWCQQFLLYTDHKRNKTKKPLKTSHFRSYLAKTIASLV